MDEALMLARGRYQRNLILGNESWSGSTIRGSARQWSANYLRSRKALLDRLEDADLAYLTIGPHGKLTLAFGGPPGNHDRRRVNCGYAWVPPPPTILDTFIEAVYKEDEAA